MNQIKHLMNPDDAIFQLNYHLEHGSLGEFLLEVQNVSLAQGGLAQLASATGLGRESLYKILSARGNPHLITFIEILRALGLTLKIEKCGNRFPKLSRINLSQTHAQLAKEWHPSKNNLAPENVRSGSHLKVWWRCSKSDDHEWVASIIKRAYGSKCPMCAGLKVAASNALFKTHPKLAAEWHPQKNSSTNPHSVMAASNKKIVWRCSSDHEWVDSVRNRALGQDCSRCK